MPQFNRELAILIPQLERVNIVLSDRKDEWTALVFPDANVAAQWSKLLRYLVDLCANVGHAI